MTHEYTILTGGTVLAGKGAPECTAIAWAGNTVLFVGSDEDARAISRGDSHFIDLAGAFVAPVGESLEAGGPADLAVLDQDPRISSARTLVLIRDGRIVSGRLERLLGQ